MPGTIRKRGSSWQALLSYRDPKTGRQTQVSATRPTKRDAEIALAELLLRRDKGRQPGDGRQKFNELVDTWLEFKQRTAQPSSLMRYDSALRVHLRPTFGAMALRSITPARIDAWYAAQHSQGLPDNSVRQHHDLLSNILRYAVRTLKWLPSNPADDANPPKRASTVVHLPDTERLAALIEAADDDGLLFGTFVRMIVCTGARRSEICALQWKHVDLEAGRIAVQASIALGPNGFYRKLPKSGRVRTIALPSAMVDHLALYRSYRVVLVEQLGGKFDDDCYLFDCHPEGRRTGHPGTMSEKFQTAKRVAGMKEVRLHDLRHHAATVLLNNRVSPSVVAERLGHTRVSTTLDSAVHRPRRRRSGRHHGRLHRSEIAGRMSDRREELRAFVRAEEPPPNATKVVLRGGPDTEALLATHARRLHRAFVLDGRDVYGISVFVALDDVGPASQRGLLTGKLLSYPLVYTPTVGELVDAEFELLATFGRPHFTVVFRSPADVPRLLAALGPLRPNRYA